MREKPTIQKFLASLLLVLFTISFIPKSFFHDVIANHKDVVGCEKPEKIGPCVHQQNFHCTFTDLVVTAPYVAITVDLGLPGQFNCPAYTDHYLSSFLQQYFLGSESRGPPVVVVD